MTILIQNGHVIDPLTGRDEVCDVLVRDGKIQKIGTALSEEAEQVLDASGCYVMPGLIDLHVHFRDPGLEYKETLETGAIVYSLQYGILGQTANAETLWQTIKEGT